MKRRHLVALGLFLSATACGKPPPESVPPDAPAPSAQACGLQPDGSRRFRVLHLNDIYRIEGLADGRGGLARIRSVRTQLERDCDAVLVTHAGDALFPSLLSREFEGAQMITVLNALDGDTEGFDARLIATFGNHEFDKGALDDAKKILDKRVEGSQFTWLDTTIEWATIDGQPAVSAPHLVDASLLTLGGVEVGLFSLTVAKQEPEYVDEIRGEYVEEARAATEQLREQGAEVVLALTHLDVDDDQRILDELGDAGPDLILGGHDHDLMTVYEGGEQTGPRAVLKGDADGVRVRAVEIWVDASGEVGWQLSAGVDSEVLGPGQPEPDPAVSAIVDGLLAEHAQLFCASKGAEPGCLDEKLTVAGTDLIAEETEIRRYETNFGDWAVDQMLATFPEADLAILNSGSLRLNQDIAAGTEITRRIVEETFAYPISMQLIEIDGATLQQVLDRSVENWSAAGHWLQIAGLAYRHDVGAQTATGAVLLPDREAIEPKRKYRVVATEFLLGITPGSDQDGYLMLKPSMKVEHANNGADLVERVVAALTAAGDAGIAPVFEGRICSSDRADQVCLAG
ncbi:Trifunctional nucleotide phosphoesterase protein YfkN precursor [Enhygromyxa salina]|uniref:Trifunctional nucleotide phosphoesterase protein YfkN n=1 Tax=Enhygromyxa salina TaxID=215803 RepID=A0A2S9XUK0_9BACT|nr:bifunctional metallophosphatase/5'-nucleotidase [Enhygromyxa salina]PRP96548.1 Trifunctional nucleotide phosphoesterase protein YfkN precursor [Enhygromyxa salina]